jgi:hypothetical protein
MPAQNLSRRVLCAIPPEDSLNGCRRGSAVLQGVLMRRDPSSPSERQAAPRSGVSRRTVTRGAAWSLPIAVVAIPAPAFAASPACTITQAGPYVYYDAKYTCSPAGNPSGFDPERYLMAFGVTPSNCPDPLSVPGPVLVRVQEVGDPNRPLTLVSVANWEVTVFGGLEYNGQSFPAGTYLAVTFFHPTGWGSPNVNGNTFYDISLDGGTTWLGPYDLFNFELGNLDTADIFDPDRDDTYLCT